MDTTAGPSVQPHWIHYISIWLNRTAEPSPCMMTLHCRLLRRKSGMWHAERAHAVERHIPTNTALRSIARKHSLQLLLLFSCPAGQSVACLSTDFCHQTWHPASMKCTEAHNTQALTSTSSAIVQHPSSHRIRTRKPRTTRVLRHLGSSITSDTAPACMWSPALTVTTRYLNSMHTPSLQPPVLYPPRFISRVLNQDILGS